MTYEPRLKLTTLLSLTILLICLGPMGGTEVKAQQPLGKETLSHLEGTFVFVSVGEPIQELGIEESSLKTNVELQLRKADVTVYDKEEYSKKESPPGLVIAVSSVGTTDSMSVYWINLSLIQIVEISNGEKAQAITYLNTEDGATLTGEVDMIRDDVEEVVKRFLNDWLEVH